MNISTLPVAFFLAFFSSSLFANPVNPTLSEVPDKVFLTECFDGANNGGPSPASLGPDSLAAWEAEWMPPTFIAIGDFCGTGSGSIDLTPDASTSGPWVYLWSTGETTQDISGLSAGLYTVTIFSLGDGITQSQQIGIVNNPPSSPQSITGVVTGNTLCNGTSNGAIDLTVFPMPAIWDYLWSNGETVMDISNLTPGTYTVSVTIGVTCTTTAEFFVPNLTNAPMILIPDQGWNWDYCDQSNGWAIVGPFGGSQPYTYLWSNGNTNQLNSGLAAGTYTVTVTGADGCTATHQETVEPRDLPVSVASYVEVPNTTCIGANGSISIMLGPSGVWHANATYLWSNGATTQNISNLPSGTYFVTVTREGTCTATEGFHVDDEPVLPELIFSSSAASCGKSNGALTLTNIGGTPPFTYIWSNGQTTQSISGVPVGTYSVTLTGNNGCTGTGSATVEDNPPVFDFSGLVTDHASCDTTNGAISLSLFPSSLTLLWSNGATTANLKNLAPGDYTVTVSAGGTCTLERTFSVADLTVYPVIPLTPAPSRCSLANGSIDLNVTAGQPPFTYLWSNGATTEDIFGIKADTFSVLVTSAVGCVTHNVVIVPNVNDTIKILENIVDNISCANPTGNIALNVTPLDTLYTYLWAGGQTVDSLSNLPAGSYFVTVTLGVSCIALDTFVVADHAPLPVLSSSGTSAICSLNNGAADLSVDTTGVAPYTFIWSNSATTEDLANLAPGDYFVTVTGANSCAAIDTVSVLNSNTPLSIIGTPAENTTCAAGNGAIDIGIVPAGTYTYSWSNSASTEDLSNLPAGIYTVTVSLGTCLSSNTFTVANNALLPSLSTASTAASCDFSNGAADLSVNAGVGPYAFTWSNSATTEDLSNLPPGTYSVTVTGTNSCTAVNSVSVANNNIPLNINGAPVANTSCAAGNGAIDIGIVPAGTYAYSWSNSITTEDLSNLPAGTYTVTVSLGTCLSSSTFTIVNNTLLPSLSTASTAASCDFSNGAADLSVSAGVGPYAFTWSNSATTEDLSNLPPGTYSVTVTGSNSCTSVSTVNVLNNNIALNINGAPVANTSCAAGNGSVDIGIAPAGTYAYSWSNSASTEDLSNLPPGTYTVTVSLGTCLSSSTFTVTNNALPPNLSSSGTAASCDFSNGAADLNVNGGTGPYAFTWSNSATTEDLSNLPPGTYSVIVTGSNSCTSVSTVNVLNNNIALNINGAPAENTSCVAANGSINIGVAPAGTYSYSWSNAAMTEDVSNLAAGTYTVTVSLGTCLSSSTFAVGDNTAAPNLSSNITASICSVDNGGIDLSVSGTAAPYNYVWSNSATTEDLANLFPGNYTVTVTAANGCTAATTLNVPNNAATFSLAGAPTALTNCAADNGAIDLSITPAGAFTILWSNGAITEDVSGLAPGTYTVSVTASGSCTATASYFIVDQRTDPITSQAVVPEICGLADGSIDVGVSGGTIPYNYLWAGGQSSEDLTNLTAGTYTLVVTDVNGCTATTSATVPGNSISFALAGSAVPNTSCTLNNGSIDLTVNPAAPAYAYLWSNGKTTAGLSGLNAGNYQVTVSAGGNCTNTAAFTIANDVPTPLLSQNIAAAFCGQASGSIDLTVTGSPAPHGYIWSNAAMVEDLSAIVSGNYTVTVTAANGCTAVETFAVPENVNVPAIGSLLTSATSCATNNGAIDLTITPPLAAGYSFMWFNGSTSEDLANLAAGTYSVTVNGGGTCTSTAVLTVASNVPQPLLSSNNIAAATCGQASGSIDLSVTGSPAPYGYIWSNSATVEDLSAIVSGIYSVTVTAANGCTSVGNYTVQENTIVPGIASSLTPANSCLTNNGAIDLTVTPALGYTFSWSNSSITEDLSNLAAGSYTVTVNGGGSCTNTASFLVADQTTQPQANIASSTTTLNCSITAITLNGSVTGTPNATTTVWSSNGNVLGNGNSLSVNAPGQYDFVVTDNVTFCTATASITIGQNLSPPMLSVANPALLTCVSPSQTLSGSSTVGGVQFAWAAIAGTDTTILGSGATLSVNAAGTYFLFGANPANNCANAVSVNVVANQDPPVADAGAPFTLDCAGETAGLNGSGSGAPNLAYQWASQDGHFVSGANTATPLIDEAGTYLLSVTDPANGCTGTDEVVIVPEIPVAFASVAQPTCLEDNGTVLVDSVTGLSDPILYSLNNGQASFQNQFSNLVPGTYTILAEGGNGCAASVEAIVEAPAILEIALATEAEVALGYSYQIDAQVNIPSADIASITWTPAQGLSCDTCLSPLATPFIITEYQLTVVSKAGCEARSKLLLTVDKAREIYVPNIFSPSEGGPNGTLTIFADPVTVLKIKSFQVFSRWGEAVHERFDFLPGDAGNGWDGSLKGQKLNPAVFVWQAVAVFADGKEEFFKGDVTLQR